MTNTGYTTKTGKGTRITRGITLYREHHEEIADIGDGFFLVPSSEPGRSYVVDLEREICDCADRAKRCKHITATTIYRAKGGGREWSPSPAQVCRRLGVAS